MSKMENSIMLLDEALWDAVSGGGWSDARDGRFGGSDRGNREAANDKACKDHTRDLVQRDFYKGKDPIAAAQRASKDDVCSGRGNHNNHK